MSRFKDIVQSDVHHIFMNLDEFSDIHVVNGKKMTVQIDNNELIDREKRYQYNRSLYADGVYLKEILMYVKAEEFGKLPAVGRTITLDRKTYIVSDAVDENGIYTISLGANKT